MEKNIQKNCPFRFAVKSFLALSLSLLMTSCVMQTGAYTETDGVYYNPNTDTLPEGYVTNEGNQVGDYYNYQDQSIIDKSKENQNLKNNRYNSWNSNENTDSDWGNFAGTEINYSPYYDYMYGNVYTMGLGSFNPIYYGLGNWYWSFYDPFWARYYGFNGYYNPYYGYYNPYYGFNYPYYGGGYYGGYNNYYGGYYGNNYNPYRYKRSGENGGGLHKVRKSDNNSQINNYGNNGFRNPRNGNQNPIRTRNNTYTIPNQNSGGRYRNTENSVPIRTRQQDPPRQRESVQPRREMNNDYRRESSSGGFRQSESSNNSYRPSAPTNGGGFGGGSSSSSGGGSTRSSGGGIRR
ncbi:prolyl-tRNA synthetase [Halpernia sp.]|uniref:prolyl-tRNA synthetase n=1 Tax=Halpernia sp. TaxID=2782209 RepID=UPI003A8D6505